MRRGIKQIAIRPEGCLRAVAMMDIEIDNGDPFGSVNGSRMKSRDGGIVEKAKPHGALGFGMMSRGTDRAKGVLNLARHDSGRRLDRSSCGMKGGLQRSRRHERITIDINRTLFRRSLADQIDIRLRVNAADRFVIRLVGLLSFERGKNVVFERFFDGAKPVGPLGVAGTGIVIEKTGMC